MSLKELEKRLYINGEWVTHTSGKWLDVVEPATEDVVFKIPNAGSEDVEKAIKAARNAFERPPNDSQTWSGLTGAQRAVYLRKIADLVEQNKKEFSVLEARDCGKPVKESAWDMDDVSGCFRFYAELAEKLDKRQGKAVTLPEDYASKFTTVTYKEPLGVVVSIIPWNYPLLMAAWKLAPALASGCTIVLKPSEITPLSAIYLTTLISKMNPALPPGVLNLVQGDGPTTGDLLTKNTNVDKIAFTGSVPTARKIQKNATEAGITRVSLELGGKSSVIVFDDVDIDAAVEWVMFGCFWTNGQICSATSRLVLNEAIYDTFLQRLQKEVANIKVRNPLVEEDGTIGPLVSKAQWQRVLNYIETAKKEGAKVLVGGGVPKERPENKGFYVEPTVLVDVKQQDTVWREEIFGPVLSVIKFKTEEEAIKIANEGDYGLGGAVLTSNTERAKRVTRRLRSGIVWVNCSQPCFVQGPWGGMKKSGSGHRELGKWGLEGYVEVKQVTEYTSKEAWGWYPKSGDKANL